MAVYVDGGRYPYRGMLMSHMLAEPGELAELHAMASALGLRRHFQGSGSCPHYDVCQAKRAQAIRLGAVVIDRRRTAELVRLWREHRVDQAGATPRMAAAASPARAE